MRKLLLIFFGNLLLLITSSSPTLAGQYGSPKKGVGGEYSAATSATKVSWFYNWQHYSENSFKQGVRFVPMARVGKSESANCTGPWKYPDFSHYQNLVRNTARNHPGSYWLIGNEPSLGDQDAIQLECALSRYKAAIDFIRQEDPKAQFIVGGFHLNPNRPQVNDFGPALLPLKNEAGFAGWHIHIYVDSQKDVASSVSDFQNILNHFINWLQTNNAGDELWVTEFLECFWGGNRTLNEANIKLLMQQIVPLLEDNRSVTRYAWYLHSDPAGQSWPFALFSHQSQLKSLGQTYSELATTDTPPNPVPTPSKTYWSGWNAIGKDFGQARGLPSPSLSLSRLLGGLWQTFVKGFGGINFALAEGETYHLKAWAKVVLEEKK